MQSSLQQIYRARNDELLRAATLTRRALVEPVREMRRIRPRPAELLRPLRPALA